MMDGSRLYYGKENPDLEINTGSSTVDTTKETTVLRWTAPRYWREDLWYYFKNNNLIFSTMFVDPDNPLDSNIRLMLLFTQLCFLYFVGDYLFVKKYYSLGNGWLYFVNPPKLQI